MGVFEHFPYTNFHELNLDWILAKIKELDGGLYDRVDAIITDILSGNENPPANSNLKADARNAFVSGANYAPFELYEVLKTYMDNADKLFYGAPSFVGYDYDGVNDTYTPRSIFGKYGAKGESLFPIVCVTLVQLALMGVGYENCRINTGHIEQAANNGTNAPRLSGGENVPYSGQNAVNLESAAARRFWGDSGHGSVYSAEFAQLLSEAGLLHTITKRNFTELSPGDILFYQTDDAADKWNSIGHCDIFLGWNGNNITVISTDSKNAPVVKYVKYNYTGSSFLPGLKWFARIPKPGNPGTVKNLTSYFGKFPHTFSTDNTSTLYVPLNPGVTLERNRAYTASVEFSGNVPETLYFNIVGYKGGSPVNGATAQIFINNKGQRYGKNKYYCLFVMPNTGGVDAFRLGANCPDNFSVTVDAFQFYDKVVNPVYPCVSETVNSGTQTAEVLNANISNGTNLYYTVKNGLLNIHGRFSVTAQVTQYSQLFKIANISQYGNTTGEHRLALYGTNGIYVLKLDPTSGIVSMLGSTLTPGTTYVIDGSLPVFLA